LFYPDNDNCIKIIKLFTNMSVSSETRIDLEKYILKLHLFSLDKLCFTFWAQQGMYQFYNDVLFPVIIYLGRSRILALKFILFETFFDILIVFLIICKKRRILRNRPYRHSAINFHFLNSDRHKACTATWYI